VLGGSSGIGLATAVAAAADAAFVTIASRSQAKLDAALTRLAGNTRAVVLDTGDEAGVDRFFTGEAPWDHVVVSAAQTCTGPVKTLALADVKTAMESTFWAAYRIAQAAKIKDGGSLTFVSGFLSVRPSASSVLQGAINAALEALARGLALELAPVRVNAQCRPASSSRRSGPAWPMTSARRCSRARRNACRRAASVSRKISPMRCCSSPRRPSRPARPCASTAAASGPFPTHSMPW
jgi:NAD(P)-dependent dehydrogenase (short-subunit alcohol dehydrogenase family)